MTTTAPTVTVDRDYTLDHKYTRSSGRIYLSGIQALVRLPLMQQMRDRALGLNTAGFLSGYRGSPLGGLDQALWSARKHLKAANVEFAAGLNEDLAATAVWGSQQVNLFPGARYDGVYAMWYGKGPGVDRTGDVFKHGNAAGTSKHGGVLVLAGDDHACRSSTLPHQSEHEFISAMMPILNPAGVQDILDMGMLGWAMSRYTGRWVGFKTIAETVESSASVLVDPHQLDIVIPSDVALPPGGLNIRWPDPPMQQELRLHQYAMHAAIAFARANGIDRVVFDSPRARLGIITTGKSYLDVLQALEYLGLDEQACRDVGIRVYKVGMTWPIEPEGLRAFAHGLEDIIVVEEKRSFLEAQLKEHMYNWAHAQRPSIVGKYDEAGNWVLPSTGELTPATIALVIAARVKRFYTSERIEERLTWIAEKERELALPRANFVRAAHYCSGCPHNTSTVVPEGSRAAAGIGCHYMVTWMDRRTETFTQMGGEGVPWIGQAPFTETGHIFQNLGDGTYFHSGSLAIRACVAAKVNITFKILYNDAVAMTGGQPVDGTLSVDDLIRQVHAENVSKIWLLSDDPDKYRGNSVLSTHGVSLGHRDELDAVQRQLRETGGVSVLIYEQTCAAEKRRRRKRKLMVDPPKRTFINQAVCEGCGDCGTQSNCVSILPVDTEFGRKRAIDQSSCNKDFSCVKGFCPSFVTIHGGGLKKRRGSNVDPGFDRLPYPSIRSDLSQPWNVLITGVGGTGVVTIGALLGMAGHLEGKGVSVLDQTGLAQKGGAVTCHVRIAQRPEHIHAVRIAAGEADLVIGCDVVVVNDYWALSKIREARTHAVINEYQSYPGSFTRDPDMQFPLKQMLDAIGLALGHQNLDVLDATTIATNLMGDSIATNLFVLGYAWQKGLVPISLDALMRAIELNGAAVAMNQRAFAWGRLAAHDLAAVKDAAGLNRPKLLPVRSVTVSDAVSWSTAGVADTLDELIARHEAFLSDWQDTAYAARYRSFVDQVRAAEQQRVPGSEALTRAVARYLGKLMAYKDEFEVARLYTSGEFEKQLRETFDGDYTIAFNLAPPLWAKKDPVSGHLKKAEFGPWVFKLFRVLAKLRKHRGAWWDVFSKTAERRMERALIEDYRQRIEALLPTLSSATLARALEIASVPEHIRGYGHVKEASVKAAQQRWEALSRAPMAS
ncbi:MAG: indolepyruvate ferredoxin oxidoreductase family protein [Lysobacterales bacterium]